MKQNCKIRSILLSRKNKEIALKSDNINCDNHVTFIYTHKNYRILLNFFILYIAN